MNLLGLDLNATNARAVHGPLGEYALGLPLDPPGQALAMVLSLENHTLEVGRAGLRLVRNLPYLTCSNFLSHLGSQNGVGRRWRAGRHHVDSTHAMTAVWQRLNLVCSRSQGVVLSLPSYLSHQQADLVRGLGSRERIPVLGSLSALLAVALAGYAEQSWSEAVVVIDIDDHALSIGLVRATEGQARVLECRHFPNLGLKTWKDRLINALADTCVMQSRRDPRDVPQAEQSIFDQLDALLEAGMQGRMIQLGIQAPQWYQNILVHPDQAGAFCAPLCRQVTREIESFFQLLPADEPPPALLMTAAASRLPGVAMQLHSLMEDIGQEPRRPSAKSNIILEDFGEGLIQDALAAVVHVSLLAADAPARAAHAIGAHFKKGHLPAGHLEIAAPLPLPHPVEAGPPRLQFQGQDYFLTASNFVLGSQNGCHLLFDGGRYPVVSPRHCEILFDHRAYLVLNRSRDGTLLNDVPVAGSSILQPGDWIRLGPEGPQVRFLGHLGGRPMTA